MLDKVVIANRGEIAVRLALGALTGMVATATFVPERMRAAADATDDALACVELGSGQKEAAGRLFEAEGINTLFGIPDPNFVHLFLEAERRGNRDENRKTPHQRSMTSGRRGG